MNKIKKGKLNFDQSGRAYPDNPEIDENWDCIWENDGKYYRLVGLPYHAEWSELKSHKFELSYKERYHIWFKNNYETGMEYNPEIVPDFDNDYYEPTPTKLITVTYNDIKTEIYD